jgi:NAD(P)-dependent dehydrogenase (short-subunit alcohol dehydrogenase family)
MNTERIAQLFNLDGKVALVTGGGRGLGRSIVLALADAGANVVVADLNETDAKQTAAEAETRGVRAIVIKVDVGRREDVEVMAASARDALGGVDILVNNAGIATLAGGVLTLDPDGWERTLRVNLTGAFLCARAIAPGMIERGWGKIVNIGSSLSSRSSVANISGGAGDYCASKAAVQSLTRSLAWEVASHNINVNAVAPGTAHTPLYGEHLEMIDQYLKPTIPFGRLAEPEEVAHAVLFLVSEAARYITGQTLHVNGGQIMVD